MLTSDVVDAVETAGYARLREGFDPADADQMRSVVWRALGERGVRQDDTSTWTAGRPGKTVDRLIQSHRVFRAFWSSEVVSALDALLGAGCWSRPTNAGDILLTFPDSASLVHQLDPFHSDFAMDVPADPMFAVNIFAFLAPVGPSGGGTLVMRNSHRLVRRYLDALSPGFPRRRAAAQFGADHKWLLASGSDPLIGASFDCDGIEVRVEELTGDPGDVVLTHPWMLHAGASNIGVTPRMMLRHRILRTPPS